MTARFLLGDVFEQMASLPDHSVDLVVTSPPFWRQRAYLPQDHPDKAREIGQEASPVEFIAVMLRLTAEWRRLLTRYGSIAIELGDTMAGSGGAGGDYTEDGEGFRPGQPKFKGSAAVTGRSGHRTGKGNHDPKIPRTDALPKSHCQIPELYRAALAYGDWPVLSGAKHEAGQWIVRNTVRWVRPNPTPGDDGDKFRRATSDIVCATLNPKRWWDGDAVRVGSVVAEYGRQATALTKGPNLDRGDLGGGNFGSDGTRPLYDWWEIAPQGYPGAHYAVWTPEIARRLIETMCPRHVCLVCGEPRRRIVEADQWPTSPFKETRDKRPNELDVFTNDGGKNRDRNVMTVDRRTLGWTDCGHDSWRPGHILDPFGGSGTTGAVATGLARDCTLIDIDSRNLDLARERIGMFLEEAS